jgi:hypothetical protein
VRSHEFGIRWAFAQTKSGYPEMLETRSACCRQPEVSDKGLKTDERELTDEHPHGHKRHDDERIHPINRHGSVPQEGNGNDLIPEQH